MVDLQRLLAIPILGAFLNLGFLFLLPDILFGFPYSIGILIFETFIIADIVIRPVSQKADEYRRPRIFTVSLFLMMPVLLIAPVFEKNFMTVYYLTSLQLGLIFLGGLIIQTFGGLVLLLSRFQLRKYGGSRIAIEDDHMLIQTGLYKHVRHPMYLGFLNLFAGYTFMLGGILITIIWTTMLFFIFKERMEQEEAILVNAFGEEYEIYMNKTSRLIPHLY